MTLFCTHVPLHFSTVRDECAFSLPFSSSNLGSATAVTSEGTHHASIHDILLCCGIPKARLAGAERAVLFLAGLAKAERAVVFLFQPGPAGALFHPERAVVFQGGTRCGIPSTSRGRARCGTTRASLDDAETLEMMVLHIFVRFEMTGEALAWESTGLHLPPWNILLRQAMCPRIRG